MDRPVARFARPEDHHKVLKGWGHEVWLANEPGYCGKILRFEEDKKCSWHYHKLKSETFLVQGPGMLRVHYGYKPDRSDMVTVVLCKGETLDIPAGMIHQMQAVNGHCVIFEFSTHHEDSDSYRVEAGDVL
jgi:D-lyxose ketol-isomerase